MRRVDAITFVDGTFFDDFVLCLGCKSSERRLFYESTAQNPLGDIVCSHEKTPNRHAVLNKEGGALTHDMGSELATSQKSLQRSGRSTGHL